MDVVAIDWSGAKIGAASRIWAARARGGVLLELQGGRDRTEVIDHLIAGRDQFPDGLTVGLDFAFSFPAWFLRERACSEVGALWHIVAVEGEQWLADCLPPFWGRPGRSRPDLAVPFRRCELTATAGGIAAKSAFQIGGAGAVGTGSIRGMPHLPRLREAGFGIWPFDPPSLWTVVEIYPRLLTGAVHKRNAEHRTRYLAGSPWSLSGPFSSAIGGSEDAFDAAISALVMSRHSAQLASLPQTVDPVTLLEGDVWRPPTLDS
ncbi:MAG TPA: hypothetical protein VGL48_00820 [Acidimicrobiales bacterium]